MYYVNKGDQFCPLKRSKGRRKTSGLTWLTTLAHTESNMRTTFILFYSCLADEACVTD